MMLCIICGLTAPFVLVGFTICKDHLDAVIEIRKQLGNKKSGGEIIELLIHNPDPDVTQIWVTGPDRPL